MAANEDRDRILSEYIGSKEGKEKIAMAAADLIRQKLRGPSMSRRSIEQVEICPECGMPEPDQVDGHPEDECTVYRVMES